MTSEPEPGGMQIRGKRECDKCGNQWSYYDTGSVTCPSCGSVRSVGLDESPRLHTDGPTSLDLTPARRLVQDEPVKAVATAAEDVARKYRLERGFLHGGELRPLDDVYVATVELRHAAAGIRRSLGLVDDTRQYFLDLLADADKGKRPSADHVPRDLRWARGLAAATVVEDYRRDLTDWLDQHPSPEIRSVYDELGQLGSRMAALDGDVPAAEADHLISATQALGTYLITSDEGALARASDRLTDLT